MQSFDSLDFQYEYRDGGHSLLNHVRILSGTGVLLEEIQNYNVLCYLMYTYDTNNTKERKLSSKCENKKIYPYSPGSDDDE